MDDDRRDLANGLFTTATALLEDAVEAVVAGQSSRQDRSQLADAGHRPQAYAHNIMIIAEAAAIIANLGENPRQNLRESWC